MSLLKSLFRNKEPELKDDPNPGEIHEMPTRPYTILHADLSFYTDPECRFEARAARLIVMRCDDPRQKDHPVECMPTSKRYRSGQTVTWDINPKRLWQTAYYLNPDTGNKERAWAQAVEFIGKVVNTGRDSDNADR